MCDLGIAAAFYRTESLFEFFVSRKPTKVPRVQTSMQAIAQHLKTDYAAPKAPLSPWLWRSIFDVYPSAVAILDQSGIILYANRAWNHETQTTFCGPRYRAGESYFQLCEVVPTEMRLDAVAMAEGIRRVISGEQENFQHKYSDSNLSARQAFLVQVAPLKLPGSTRVMVSHQRMHEGDYVPVASCDIGQRVRAEREIRGLSGRLIRVQEEERSRIARELHDDISQKLALLTIELEELGGSLVSPGEIRKRAHALWRRARELSSDIHRISHNLHPSKLDHLGLVSALRSLCREGSEHRDLQIDFTSHDIPDDVPRDVSVSLFRVAQEAIRNVMRHSGSSRARVELACSANELNLRVTDSGSGFDARNARSRRGLGLISMQERLRLVGGELLVRSKPSRGTQVEARVPLKAPDS